MGAKGRRKRLVRARYLRNDPIHAYRIAEREERASRRKLRKGEKIKEVGDG